jgi:hypothetical protein
MAHALEANGVKVYIIGRRKQVLAAAAASGQYGNTIPLPGGCRIQTQLGRCGRAHRSGHGICQSRDRELGDHGTQLHRAPAQAGWKYPQYPTTA